jgi:hypothetical protein
MQQLGVSATLTLLKQSNRMGLRFFLLRCQQSAGSTKSLQMGVRALFNVIQATGTADFLSTLGGKLLWLRGQVVA